VDDSLDISASDPSGQLCLTGQTTDDTIFQFTILQDGYHLIHSLTTGAFFQQHNHRLYLIKNAIAMCTKWSIEQFYTYETIKTVYIATHKIEQNITYYCIEYTCCESDREYEIWEPYDTLRKIHDNLNFRYAELQKCKFQFPSASESVHKRIELLDTYFNKLIRIKEVLVNMN
jgi:hypothetical protein